MSADSGSSVSSVQIFGAKSGPIGDEIVPGRDVTAVERWAALLLFSAALSLRLLFAFRYKVDTDEPQHLHVVWGWVNGLLQYRDIFDNHTPLFHMLFAPVYALFGERLETFYLIRLTMLPLFAVALWITYRLARALYSARAALWITVLTALFPSFFLLSVEFRTDVLWAVFWLWAILILTDRPLSIKRGFFSGLLLGASVGVSMKTSLLLGALGLSAVATLSVCCSRSDLTAIAARFAGPIIAILAGLLVVPAGLIFYFYSHGAIEPFIYGTLQHNVVPGLGRWGGPSLYMAVFPASCLILWVLARIVILRYTPDRDLAARRIFIFFLTGLYVAALEGFWPLVTPQNYLPIVPLIFVSLTPWCIELLEWRLKAGPQDTFTHRSCRAFSLTLSTLGVFEIALLLTVGSPWHDGTVFQATIVKEVLSLTDPRDSVMDLKGETIFRNRPFYYALETITRKRMQLGMIEDDIPERLVATRTFVAGPDSPDLPPRARSFLKEAYLPVGFLRAAGCMLPGAPDENGFYPFQVVIPGRYSIVSESGPVYGLIDGEPLTEPRFLEPGPHIFQTTSPSARMALVWAQAIERGFSPLALRNPLP